MASLWRHLDFLQTIVHISNSIEHKNFILGTTTWRPSNDESLSDLYRPWRSHMKFKGHQKRNHWHILQTITRTDIIPDTKVQYNKRHLMASAFLTLRQSQSHTSRSNVTDVEVSALSECLLLLLLLLFYFRLTARVTRFATPMSRFQGDLGTCQDRAWFWPLSCLATGTSVK